MINTLICEIIMTIFVIYRIITWTIPDKKNGQFLFYTKYHKRKIINILIALFLYLLLLFVFLFVLDVFWGKIACIFPIIWLIYIILPDKIYENGIRNDRGFTPWSDIENIYIDSDERIVLQSKNPINKKLYIQLDKDVILQILAEKLNYQQ